MRLKWTGSLAAQREYEEALRKNPPRPRKKPKMRTKRQRRRVGRAEPFRVTPDNYEVYLATPHWKQTAARKRKATGFRCERCGSRGYEIHHKHYRTLWREQGADLECLCRGCHEAHHGTDTANLNHLRSI